MLGIGKKQDPQTDIENAYELGRQDAGGTDRAMSILDTPPTNDLTKLFDKWTKPANIKNAPASRLVIPSFSTTNYSEKINEHFELYSARNQIATVLMCLIQPLAEEYPDAGFEKYLSILIVPIEVDNASRRSLGGFMVKETGTRRAEVTQKRPQSKPGDMIRRPE
jgi:hypothetical protein